MKVIDLTTDQFRCDFCEFSDFEKYKESLLSSYIKRAYSYISNKVSGVLSEEDRTLALELMTAHLLTLRSKILSNTATGQIASTSIDAISVSLVAPVNKNAWQYWLNSTPYGQQLLALLQAHAPAGLYFGGSCQRVFR